MRRFIFWLKKKCDRYLYGQVLVPAKHCPGCGDPTVAGEAVTPPYHAKCSPPTPVIAKEATQNG